MENRVTGWRRYVLIQPPVMILLYTLSMSGNIFTDLIEYQTCRSMLKSNNSLCLLLHKNSSCAEALEIDTLIQPQTTLILTSKAFIQSVLPTFFSLFLGPWSDKYGRKPLILSGYVSALLTFFMLSVMTNWDISPWYFLLAYIPTAFFGGFCIVILATICYISDISDEQDRAWHLAWLDVCIQFGILLGLLTTPIIFEKYGYSTVFGICTLCCTVGALYIYFCVPETIASNTRTLSSIFDISLVKDLVNTCTKKREGVDRCKVWLCMACITLFCVALEGQISVSYLFSNARLGWNIDTYSIYMAVNILITNLGTILSVSVLKIIKARFEEIMCILSVLSSFGYAVMMAFTWKPWHMYLAMVIGMWGSLYSPIIRSILSKSVSPQDAGKVFSLMVSIETLTPFGAISLYGQIYTHYMPPFYPSPVWLMSAVLYIVIIILLINLFVQSRKVSTVRYATLAVRQ